MEMSRAVRLRSHCGEGIGPENGQAFQYAAGSKAAFHLASLRQRLVERDVQPCSPPQAIEGFTEKRFDTAIKNPNATT